MILPEYALSLNISKLRGINSTEKGEWLSNHWTLSMSSAPLLELLSLTLFVHVLVQNLKLKWGVKSITTGEPRDRIATTGK